jgi:2-polyprenyl-6-methoxyphenol hydroxylase-like FAD-dependent oxidoreductase
MRKVLVLGAGPCGLAAGMMLARDGHEVTVLERDPAPVPDTPEAAWEGWGRGGVAQFRQAHLLQARGREVLDAELPGVREALEAAGALRLDPLARMPRSVADRRRAPEDDRLTTVTARRPTIEQVLARAAEAEPGLEVRRGVRVAALRTREADGRLHVTGVRDARGGRLDADLVVDAMGRRSGLGPLLRAVGGTMEEEACDSGYAYYTRFFTSSDGSTPAPLAPPLCHFGSFSVLSLPADAGTWSVTLYAAARDRPLKRLRELGPWTALVGACPLQAHWLDGEPMGPVLPMGGIADRIRRLSGPGAAAPLGLVALGDAWASTNPSLGRGITLALLHAAVLRRTVAAHGEEPARFAEAWEAATERELGPWFRATVALDRARLAEMEAARAGARPAAPDDPVAKVRVALPVAMCRDAAAFRAGLEISSCQALPTEVFARPGLAQRVLAAADGASALPGPDRARVLELVA